MTFDPPFNALPTGLLAVGILGAGFSVIWFGAKFQNKKHGFPQKKAEE